MIQCRLRYRLWSVLELYFSFFLLSRNCWLSFSSGSPIPIEYLPAENSLSSRVRLFILFQDRPTNTIAVGDPLTFRLESQEGYNYATDIFATNVIARDPYSGRSVQLIDRFGLVYDVRYKSAKTLALKQQGTS